MKIAFLLYNAYGIGGTIRSTFNLAGALSKRHDVTIVSVHRTAKRPALPLAGKVKVVDLVDLRKSQPSYEGNHPLVGEERTLMPSDGPAHGAGGQGGLLSEVRIQQYLRGTDADVVVATRPVLVACLAEFGDDRFIRIGQEHLTHAMHRDPVRSAQNAAIAGLDAWITVSEGDAAAYRKALGAIDTHIQCIPNGSPAPAVEPAAGDAKVVVAAGRLIRVKRYERMVEAFGKVAAQRPDWTLRIYGRGGKRAAIEKRIDELGLHNNVFLMGPHSPIETEWAKGAIAAVSSDGESFGMTIVEAMHCGVPVVSTDCDYGPGEIITHGQDGVLVPMGEGVVDAYADALLQLIDDEDRRRAMGDKAREKARQYLPERIAERYEDLFALLRPAAPTASEPAAPEIPRPAPAFAPGQAQPFAPVPVPLYRLLRRQAGRLLRAAGLRAPVPAKKAARPKAGCRVARGTGDLVFRLPAKRLPEGARGIVLRRRRGEPAEEIRVAFAKRPAADGYAEATVARGAHRLAEGRWDCYLDLGKRAGPRRLRAGLVETQHLLALTPPPPGTAEVAQWIPYPTSDGFLAVRTWLRAGHAEVTSVTPEASAFRVFATLHGRARAGELCAVIARSRKGKRYEFDVMAQPLGEGAIAFELPYPLAEAHREGGHDLWDLWVVPSYGAPPVRLGRLFGDRVDRKDTDVFAAHERETGMNGPVRLRPYITVHNNLSLSARDLANHDGLTDADLELLQSRGEQWRAA